MKDDRGSAVAALPILVLLVVGGLAALAGIALQPSPAPAPVAPPITAADFGPACATTPLSLADVRGCIDSQLAGVRGYQGASIEGFNGDVLVVRWAGQAPPIVTQRVGAIAAPARVAVTLVALPPVPSATTSATPSP